MEAADGLEIPSTVADTVTAVGGMILTARHSRNMRMQGKVPTHTPQTSW